MQLKVLLKRKTKIKVFLIIFFSILEFFKNIWNVGNIFNSAGYEKIRSYIRENKIKISR